MPCVMYQTHLGKTVLGSNMQHATAKAWYVSKIVPLPHFSDTAACLLPAADVYGKEWAAHEGSDKTEVRYLHQVALFLSALIQRHPVWEHSCSNHPWSSIQRTASRVLVTLQWLVGCEHLGSKPSKHLNKPKSQLVKTLWRVLHGLLIRHMLDTSLEVHTTPSDILMAATPCFGKAAMQSFQPLTELACAALKRIATDKALYILDRECRSTQEEGMQRFCLFWVFLGEHRYSLVECT